MKNLIYTLGEVNPKLADKVKKYNLGVTTNLEDKKNIVAIVVRGEIPVKKELISDLPNLKIILSAGIGFDNIDHEFAKEKNVFVVNCPYASSISTAEHSVALMLAGVKKIVKSNLEMRDSIWERKDNIGVEIFGKKVGIVGLGRIGRYVGQLYAALGMQVFAYDPFVPNYHFKRSRTIVVSSLQELAKNVNYLSIHLPKTEITSNLINKNIIRLLQKPNGIVNTSRGGIVNEDDILVMLNNESLDFYAADVFKNEPKPNQKLIQHPLVLATPHIAANTQDAQEQILIDVVDQIEDVLIKGKSPKYEIDKIHL